jgi:hypothetical protein
MQKHLGRFGPTLASMTDAAQPRVLLWDVIRYRCNQYHEPMVNTAPRLWRTQRCAATRH